jgi:Domain of unknown function (DUF5666)
MTTKILAIVGGIVVLLAVGGGAFYGGIVYEQQQAASLRNSFFAQRGGNGAGQGGTGQGGGTGFGFGGGTGQGGGNGGAGRGTFGQIKSIDGNTITVSTPQDVVTVTVSDSTMISKTVTGAIGDLKVGDTIVVRGQRDASGNVAATNIQEGAPGGFGQGQGQGPTPTAKP